MTKKLLVMATCVFMLFSLCACSSENTDDKSTKKETKNSETVTTEPEKVTETDYVNIDGIYVDSSYKDEENESLKMVYVFYTVTAPEKNISLSSISMSMKINDVNTYSSENYPGVCTYMNSYYYSSYVEEIYVGSSLKAVSTFKIPEGDLTEGKTITLSNSFIPDINDIKLSTDDIISCDGVKKIAKAVDPEGFKAETNKRKKADKETTQKVKNAINNYYWDFYVNSTSYRIEFWDPNNFSVTVLGNTNSGTYTVTNGYVMCKYPSNGYTVEIPYTLEGDGIDLDVTTGFDVK